MQVYQSFASCSSFNPPDSKDSNLNTWVGGGGWGVGEVR